MIGENWQSILTLLCVAGALFVLIRRAVGLFDTTRNSGPCGTGGCNSCDAGKPTNQEHGYDGFISFEELTTKPSLNDRSQVEERQPLTASSHRDH